VASLEAALGKGARLPSTSHVPVETSRGGETRHGIGRWQVGGGGAAM
jgi:hypothetical protein